MATETIMMTGDGYYEEGTPNPGGTTNAYTLIDDPVGSHDSGTTTILSLSGVKRNSFTFTDLTISGNITDVTVYAVFKYKPTSTANIFLRIGSTNYDSDSISINGNYVLYSVTYTADPSTGSAWTVSGINAAEIGCILTGDGKIACICTQLYAIVTYTEASEAATSAAGLLLC